METKFICYEDVPQGCIVMRSDEIKEVKEYIYLNGEYVQKHGGGILTEN